MISNNIPFYKIIKKIFNHPMVTSGLTNSIATVIRILTGLVMSKVVAVFIGPSGLFLIGQLGNFVNISGILASGGIGTGVIKYIASYKGDKEKEKALISTSFWITLGATTLLSILVVLFCNQISFFLFKTNKYSNILIIYGLSLLLSSLTKLLVSIVNGYKHIKEYVKISISSNIVGFVVSVLFILFFNVYGALLGIILGSLPSFFVVVYILRNEEWFNIQNFFDRFNSPVAKKLFHYSLMALVAACSTPVSMILIRKMIMIKFGQNDAGLWQAVTRISDYYLLFITSSFGVYYLPRLSEIKDNKVLKHELFVAYKIVVPLLIGFSVSILLLRDVIIWVLFTPEFNVIKPLFIPQLVGDFFKISSWLLSYLVVAQGRSYLYIFIEIFFALFYYFIATILADLYGLLGVCMGYAVNYILLFLFLLYVYRKLLFRTNTVSEGI